MCLVALNTSVHTKSSADGGAASIMRSSNMRLLARLLVAIVVTVLAALLLYVIFLQDERPEDGEVQSPDQHFSFSAV